MKLIVEKDMKNNAYKVDLQVLDITDTDKEKFSDFGEPIVDIGGVIMTKGLVQKFVAVQEPTTKPETQKQTVTEKQTVKETQLVFEEDGITPVYIEDGVTQKTQEVDVEKDVEVEKDVVVLVPVLDEDGLPITTDKLDEDGKVVYQLIEEEIDVVLADLGKQLRKFPSEFPISRTFTVAEFGDKTVTVALGYIDIIKTNLEAKIAEFEDKEDTFSGKVEIQL